MRRVLLSAAWLLSWLCHPAPSNAAPAQPALSDPMAGVRDALEGAQIEEAERQWKRLADERPGDPAVRYYQGLLSFYRGDYDAALGQVEAALDHPRASATWRRMHGLIERTGAVTRDFVRVASADGRYVVFHAPGKDRVMAAYALDVLARADLAVQETLGLRLPGPVRVEIFPSADALAEVSALTVEQIETTGTIALSKWDRLMITSPRALVRGYPWADTINHELVHMVVSRLTREQAPVWLQEGLAKLLEQRWQQIEPAVRLDPGTQDLLDTAVSKGELISFDDMHPSIAMLPSQDAAALAFAEVATFMETYLARHGIARLRAALALVRSGMDAREALAKAAGERFAQLERKWRGGLSAGSSGGKATRLRLRLRDPERKVDESLEVATPEARRFLRLGDLLWDRGRVVAATAEYRKAHEADDADPIVAARYARAALETGDHDAARAAVAPLAERYPDHAPAHAVLGAALLALGRDVEAAPALRQAVMVNPFDPQPQCDLARSTPDPAERARAAQACQGLRAR